MVRVIGELSIDEFEVLVERAIDRRLAVWLTQLMDALSGELAQDEGELRPDFVAALRQSLKEARDGQTVDLVGFRRDRWVAVDDDTQSASPPRSDTSEKQLAL